VATLGSEAVVPTSFCWSCEQRRRHYVHVNKQSLRSKRGCLPKDTQNRWSASIVKVFCHSTFPVSKPPASPFQPHSHHIPLHFETPLSLPRTSSSAAPPSHKLHGSPALASDSKSSVAKKNLQSSRSSGIISSACVARHEKKRTFTALETAKRRVKDVDDSAGFISTKCCG
jgi:hypothetical protein